MSMKLKKSDVPKGWMLVETHFEKSIDRKLKLKARVWLEESLLWRPKFETHGMHDFNVWNAGQVFGPDVKTLKAAISWIKRNAPKVKRKIQAAIKKEKKNSLGCECP